QGLDPFHYADAVCARFYRAVYHRRINRIISRGSLGGCARDRHLLRGGALPLHYGGGNGDGLHGRPALLVAEDHGPFIPRDLGKARRIGHFSWIQSDVLPAVRDGLSRNATALSCVSAG